MTGSTVAELPALPFTEDDPGPPCPGCGRGAHGDGIGPAVLVDSRPMHPWCVPYWLHERRERRRTMLGFQVACPHCGAAPGERCRTPSGERPYGPNHSDVGHHHARTDGLPWRVELVAV